jgi:PAS domain S-box-containing protein
VLISVGMPGELIITRKESSRTELDDSSLESRPAVEGVAALLSAIVDSSHDAIVSKTLDGIITSWNRSAELMFGYTAREAIGRSIRMIIPTDRQAEEDYVLSQIRRGETVDHFETVRVTKDGSEIDISLTISPVRDSNGFIVGASKIARDITDRKRLEREREELLAREQLARQQADDAVKVRDEFIAIAAHELRNPLNVLHLCLQMLHRTSRHPEKAAEVPLIAEKSQAQLDRFSALVDRLLDVTRARSGNFDLNREKFSLAGLVNEIAERFRSENPRAAITVEVSPDIEGNWDRLRIDQVVTNLVSNALRYGGVNPIKVGAYVEQRDAVLMVRDHGTGISPDNIARVFELFERIAPDRKNKGLGIGLWITKRIVEEHGGKITVESELGEGSTFIVRLPLENPAAD